MKKDHQKGRSRKNTANIGGAAYAPQQDEPHSKGDRGRRTNQLARRPTPAETRPKRRRGRLDGKLTHTKHHDQLRARLFVGDRPLPALLCRAGASGIALARTPC